jgi:hypothetical protein
MYKSKLQELIDKGKDVYVVFLNPEECRLRLKPSKSRVIILFPYDFSKLEVLAVNSEKEISELERKAKSLNLKNTNVYRTNMFFNDLWCFAAYAA